MSDELRQLGAAWRQAVARDDIRAGLERIYAQASDAISQRGPTCWASGRCCNFDSAGHRLYVTGLEAAYTIVRLPEAASASAQDSQRPHVMPTSRPRALESPLRLTVLSQARARGGCPFQTGNMCGVHAIKPLGCRVYFCDRSAQEWQHELSERLIADIKLLHDQSAIEYRYGEWRDMLAAFADD